MSGISMKSWLDRALNLVRNTSPSRKRTPFRSVCLGVEALEERAVPTLFVTGTTLTDTGPGGNNTITARVCSLGATVPGESLTFSVDGGAAVPEPLNGSGVAI